MFCLHLPICDDAASPVSLHAYFSNSDSQRCADVQVDVLEYYDQAIRSSRQEFPLPAVLRVKVYIRKQAKRESITLTRRNLLMRDKHTCQYALPSVTCSVHIIESTLHECMPVNIVAIVQCCSAHQKPLGFCKAHSQQHCSCSGV